MRIERAPSNSICFAICGNFRGMRHRDISKASPSFLHSLFTLSCLGGHRTKRTLERNAKGRLESPMPMDERQLGGPLPRRRRYNGCLGGRTSSVYTALGDMNLFAQTISPRQEFADPLFSLPVSRGSARHHFSDLQQLVGCDLSNGSSRCSDLGWGGPVETRVVSLGEKKTTNQLCQTLEGTFALLKQGMHKSGDAKA